MKHRRHPEGQWGVWVREKGRCGGGLLGCSLAHAVVDKREEGQAGNSPRVGGRGGWRGLPLVNLLNWSLIEPCILVTNCVHACAQSCLTLCGLMDCSPPGSSVHGVSQARILKRVANSYPRGCS